MQTADKQRIVDALQRLKAAGRSQRHIATLAGISPANITLMLQGRWGETISDELWRKVQAELRLTDAQWNTVDIWNYKKTYSICQVAQRMRTARIITYDAGFGKSHALLAYAAEAPNVVYLQCERHYTRRVLLSKFARALGMPHLSGSVAEQIDDITARLKSLQTPLVIWDEFDKVIDKSGVFDLFKTFYDATLGHAAFVLCGTPALQEYLLRRVRANKIGYVELYSRCGRTFNTLRPLSADDISRLCRANGLTDPEAIQHIRLRIGKDGDLRQLRALVEEAQLKMTIQ
jgi:DNA transposition AAA+ family ATPase